VGERPRETCRVIVLGSTGSIGTQTLSVIDHLNALHGRGEWATRYEVVGLAAGRRSEALGMQRDHCGLPESAISYGGDDSSLRLVERVECDLVVSAITGAAGLPATLRAVELGRDIALANKETLVAAGPLILAAARRSGSRLRPIDSEHSGLWQCLAGERSPPMRAGPEIARVILTASGGPFRTWTRERIEGATAEEALQHPTWKMGPKVTIDSASLMNKGLEVIEAHWLFGLEAGRIGVLIHPQSVVHAIVEYADGSALAQLGAPDMRTPIQHAICWPHRAPGCSARLDWSALRSLDFEPPDGGRFPALGLAYRAIGEGGTAGAVLNAANEEAVGAFLRGGRGGCALAFADIWRLAEAAMDAVRPGPITSLADVMEADAAARRFVRERLG
jgi:1-deoxy-D-xylulose-5-phosphate reductoisomerase